jgi:hypothetical protein
MIQISDDRCATRSDGEESPYFRSFMNFWFDAARMGGFDNRLKNHKLDKS